MEVSKMKHAIVAAVALLVAVGLAGSAGAATLISEGFNGFDTGTRPAGWTFTRCNANTDTYTAAGDYGAASPSIKLDATDLVTTATFNPSAAGLQVSFWIKGQSINPTSTLRVQQLIGASWNNMTTISGIAGIGATYGPLSMNPSSTQVRFAYIGTGDALAFDDVLIEDYTTTTVVTTTITTTTTAATIEHYVIAADDYDGDGDTDIALFDNGTMYIRNVGNVSIGADGDVPVSGDYDGDGTADAAVFSDGTWIIDGQGSFAWGSAGQIPVPGDYDGDGSTDAATYSPANGIWAIRGITTVLYGGAAGDIPIPGDYNGDGTCDRALYRWDAVEQGKWYIDIAGMPQINWGGTSDDIPVPMDYDGDGITDAVIVRDMGTALRWQILGGAIFYWGVPGDSVMTGTILGTGGQDAVTWRPWRQRWFANDGAGSTTRIDFGGATGIPAIGASY